ncbi:hypothetical protein [Azotobacter chroococcum]|uniref:hypothetical protein n=1 Tax=Azotobacter chroococcum TaxID=353 RepID=UPI000B600CC7|nr:hypothetical protein [Azotobacter chroococcum]ASL26245.1 hypothetical protein ACG10_07980 [Azotobacter chroococcum]
MATKLDLYKPDHRPRPYVLAALIALDQLANTLLCGYPDETLSSRAHREGWATAERLINALFWLDRQQIDGHTIRHCELAYLGELAREHFPFPEPA